jgi:hypothetical protein
MVFSPLWRQILFEVFLMMNVPYILPAAAPKSADVSRSAFPHGFDVSAFGLSVAVGFWDFVRAGLPVTPVFLTSTNTADTKKITAQTDKAIVNILEFICVYFTLLVTILAYYCVSYYPE